MVPGFETGSGAQCAQKIWRVLSSMARRRDAFGCGFAALLCGKKDFTKPAASGTVSIHRRAVIA
jgi:hypothetical protein